MYPVECVNCSRTSETSDLAASCGHCGSPVMLVGLHPTPLSKARLEELPPGVWRYRSFLPEVRTDEIVSLGEGGTPLLRAERLGEELGLRNLMIKDESRNPTGSFMDRGCTVLLSLANERRTKECACVTTGNLGASLAAYCAKAGIRARIKIHPGTDQGKLYQMLAFGASVEPMAAGWTVRTGHGGSLAVSAANPFLLEGEKTTGLEVVQELGWRVPDVLAVPVGTGGHLSMIWRSFQELRDCGLTQEPQCRLIGVQVGKPPGGVTGGGDKKRTRHVPPLAELEESEPFFRKEADSAVEDSGGATVTPSTSEIIDATGQLARTEGIFAEPSSASVIAALSKAVEAGLIGRAEEVVCVITASGLKDPKSVTRLAKEARRIPLAVPFAMPSPKIGGTKLALLRLLQPQPGYGYDLRRRLGPYRRMSMASVYQHLGELEDFAMVRRKGSVVARGRERVLYELTRRGSDFLKITGRLERA